MNVLIEWPSMELMGLARIELTRADLVRLTRMLDARSFGTPGIVGVHGEGADEVLALVTVRES